VTSEELKLRCLELAITQVNKEVCIGEEYFKRVAEVQTWFYNNVVSGEVPTTEAETGPKHAPNQRQARTDKSPGIFR
jgi:hypothetical protein